MGILGDAARAVGKAFSGGGSDNDDDDDKGSNYDSGSSYSRTTNLGKTRPRARGEDQDEYNARQQKRNDRWDDDDGVNVTTNVKGVTTNRFGVPQYDYSERSAKSSRDDKDGDGYSDFYTENPSSTISPERARNQQIGSRVVGLLLSPLVGLAGSTVTKMQTKGILPAGFDAGGGGTPGPLDKAVNRVLNDKNLTDAEKEAKVKEMVNNEANKNTAKNNAKAAQNAVDPLVDSVYGAAEQNPNDVFSNPEKFLSGDMSMAENVPQINANAAGTTLDGNDYQPPAGQAGYDPTTGEAVGVDGVEAKQAAGYEANEVLDDIAANGQAEAQTGELSQEAQVDAEQIDTEAVDKGQNATGRALNDWASQNMSNIIDTSTVAGKLLAEELGEGEYVDSKSTMQGQMEILSKQFVDSEGNPKIPSWAAGVARNVSRIAAFKGMTGTAATAAMSQAIMEASIPMAQQDAAFFQTLTVKNLDNRQQMTINKANVLAKMEIANLDARMQAAVTNSQSFLQMDLANLANEQQTEMVNTQARVQAMMEDSRAKNAARLFSAEAENDFTKYYDQLQFQAEQFTASQKNAMEQFNVGERNSAGKFNAQLEQQRDQFYKEMQYNVDLSNARWRQTVETSNTEMAFRAAQTDVQNMFNLSQEGMNRMWDREDAILDYTWRTAESSLDREVRRYAADRNYELNERQIENDEDLAKGQGYYEIAKLGVEALSLW